MDELPTGWLSAERTARMWAEVEAALGPLAEVEEVRRRPWGAVWRGRRAEGARVYVKLVYGGGMALDEVVAVERLARRAPASLPKLLASRPGVDGEPGWMVTADGGPSLESVLEARTEPAERVWLRVFEDYAQLQAAAGPWDEEVAVFPRITGADLAGLVEGLLAVSEQWAAVGAPGSGRGRFWTVEELRRLEGSVARARALGALLGGRCVLQHEDLGPHNVLFRAGREEPASRFFDWGESSWSHPLGGLRLAIMMAEMMERQAGGAGARLEARLVDWCRERWAVTEQTWAAAWAVEPIRKAWSWWRLLEGLEPAAQQVFLFQVRGWLRRWVEGLGESS